MLLTDKIDPILTSWTEEKPDTPTEALGIVLRIQILEKRLADKLNQVLRDYNLEWCGYDVLSTLRRQGKPYRLSAREILKDSDLSPGALTNRISRLIDRGLVTRTGDTGDRRIVQIQLTPAGLELVEKATRARFDCAEAAVENLSPSQKRKFDELLKILVIKNSGQDL